MPAPGDIEAAFAAADVLFLGQARREAFDRLIAWSAAPAVTSGRGAHPVVELFELFDPADPDVISGRRKLASALY